MPSFDITEKRPHIKIFKLNKAYYFKHFFDDPELFRELEPYYEKQHYRFKMATAEQRLLPLRLEGIRNMEEPLKKSIDSYHYGTRWFWS